MPFRSAARVSRASCMIIGLLLSPWAVSAFAAPQRGTGRGFVTDAGHPKHPGDFGSYDFTVHIAFDPVPGEAVIAFAFGPPDSAAEKDRYRYSWRRGRIFQVDGDGAEILPQSVGDVPPAAIAAIHPALILCVLHERPECSREIGGGLALAWNDELWTVERDPASPSGPVTGLRFDYASYVYGDQAFDVRYEGWPDDPNALSPGRVSMSTLGRTVLRIDFASSARVDSLGIAEGDRERDRERVAYESEMMVRPIAPYLYSIDLASLNMRTAVAEFNDYLLVFEGAWSSRNCDLMAKHIRDRFKKPVRYFAFSHLHGQYIAGTRSWVHEGATILVPPSTAPLIQAMADEGRRLRPDALASDPRPLHLEEVTSEKRIEDDSNAAQLFNVESGHTDEYLIVYFPRQKVLLTGDLLFYRPGKPLSERSLKLCENVRRLGLEIETYVATWPLDGYGTKNIVSASEVREAGGQ